MPAYSPSRSIGACWPEGWPSPDDEVRDAIAYAARVLKLIVEPGGAVALASVMSGKLDARGRTVAVVLSGETSTTNC